MPRMTTRTARGTIQHVSTEIPFEIVYSRRKTLAIHVYPDGTVRVRAPLRTTRAAIAEVVHKRAAWIVKHLDRYRATAQPTPAERTYESGEDYLFLGQRLRLNVIVGAPEGVTLTNSEVIVAARDRDPRRVQRILETWFRAEAKRIFAKRIEACWKRVEHLGLERPTLEVRRMKSRWGSCGRSGKILLNLRLVQVPLDLIDYVVVHELCHLKEHNHSKRYYAVLDAAMPDWRERRQRLNTFEYVVA